MFLKFLRSISLVALTLVVVGCGWKPDVEPSPITAPWSEMKLPVQENAVVFRSEPKEFRAAHKGDAKSASEAYVEALKAQGWEMTDFKPGDDETTASFKKGDQTMTMRAYFFDGSSTGVALEMP